MTIQEMHYDFKQKFNKIDSEQNRNLKVPEIDWKLNEAQEIFIKLIAEPRVNNHLGFETSQRTIDDIRTIVINSYKLQPHKIDDNTYYVDLPKDYMFYISSNINITKGNCGIRKAVCIVRQQEDLFEQSPFHKSSYEWKEVNITFYNKGIKIYTDGVFIPTEFLLNYIKKPAYIHNAQDFLPMAKYKLPSGELLTNRQDCELPNHTHREIVDIAVMIASGDINSSEYQNKIAKIKFNQLN